MCLQHNALSYHLVAYVAARVFSCLTFSGLVDVASQEELRFMPNKVPKNRSCTDTLCWKGSMLFDSLHVLMLRSWFSHWIGVAQVSGMDNSNLIRLMIPLRKLWQTVPGCTWYLKCRLADTCPANGFNENDSSVVTMLPFIGGDLMNTILSHCGAED